MKWIDVGDIKNWVNGKQRHCAQTLPELIRRLIFATSSTIEEINFPSGDSVANGGWDGYLKTPNISPLFPSGISAWEIGTEKTPGTKADADYLKRTSDSLGVNKNEASFVFVTPHPWPKGKEWERKKKSLGEWRDVRVVSSDHLELWLESAPAVALWLGRQIKGLSDQIRDIEGFWEEWAIATDPEMTTELVLGGRVKEVERIQNWLKNEASIIEVRGDSPDEPFAFLYGTISALPEDEKMQALSRCIIVENIQQFRTCATTFQNPLIIAAPSECRVAAALATKKGHHVFLSADSRSVDVRSNLLQLSRPRREIVEECLKKTGLSEKDSRNLARDFGRSIPVLRRHQSVTSAKAPEWANQGQSKILIPLLFAGAWDENKEGDKQLVELLSGVSYDEYIKLLSPLLLVDDSPIRKIGSIWMLKAPLDAWYIIAPNITDDNLSLFEQAVASALTKTDPKYDLEAEKRWMASVYGKSNPYSEWIRESLVESLVLIAVYGDRSPYIKTSTQIFADNVVKNILASANKWEMWASIKDVTPLLAEASPDAFVGALERIITEDKALLKELLSDDGTMFGECRHAGLLWALESISWSSEYFSRAVNTLYELSNIDCGGKWHNRPINSLKDIFAPGLPQTHVEPSQRLAVLKSSIEKDPKTTWRFVKDYYGMGSMSESHMFRWRDTGGSRRGLEHESPADHSVYIKGLLSLFTELACKKENIISAIDDFTHLSEDIREQLLKTLKKETVDSFSVEERLEIFHSIREALNWVNNYGKDGFREQIPELEEIYKKFTPENILDKYGWLISDPWPRLPQGEPKDHEAKDDTIKIAQEEAAREVLNQVSAEGIIHFSLATTYPGVLGRILGRIVNNGEEENKMFDEMIKDCTRNSIFIQGYVAGRVEKNGDAWIEQQIARLKELGTYSAETYALLYLGRKENAETWSMISKHGKDAESTYWKQATGYSVDNKKEDACIAVEKLLDVGRPAAALKIAGDSDTLVPSQLLQRLLHDFVKIENNERRDGVMDAYYLGNIFNQLYQRNDLPLDEVAKLEWPYVALFEEFKRYTTFPTALHRNLQADPLLFAQLITFLYKSNNKEFDKNNKLEKKYQKRMADVSYRLFDSWYLLPGLEDDGNLDEDKLKKWIVDARNKCLETGHIAGCDIQIGFILAHAPSNPDGTWPHVSVCNIIEFLNNETIDRHIENEIYNSRGVTSRGLNDGGAQERDLVQKYKKMSDATKDKWPRTSRLLLNISKSYELEAKRHDVDSDLHDLSWK